MVGRATRRKPEEHQDSTNSHTSAKAFPANPSAPASNKDKTRWQGFCEIESEPVSRSLCNFQVGMRYLRDLEGFFQCNAQRLWSPRRQSSRGCVIG